MSLESAQNSIYTYQKQISQLEDRIMKLRADIKKLEALEGQYESISREFSARNQGSLQQISKLWSGKGSLRSISSYIQEMTQLLSGSQFEWAEEGLIESRRIIVRKIMELESEINRLKQQIGSCEAQIQRCYAEISEIHAKEAAENV